MTVKDIKQLSKQTKVFSFKSLTVKSEERNGVPVGIIEGYASTFDIDRDDDQIMKGAFIQSIAAHRKEGRQIRMFYQHDKSVCIGGFPIDSVYEDEKGLYVRGEINLCAGQMGEYVYSLAKQGVVCDMSVGFNIPSMDALEFVEQDEKVIRQIKEVVLWEISLVTEPANASAKIVSVKSASETLEQDASARISSEAIDTCKSLSDVEHLLRLGSFSQKASKKLIAFIKGCPERDALGELPEGQRDVGTDGEEADLSALTGSLKSFNDQQALAKILNKF